MPRRKLLPQSRKPPEMVKEVDDIDETLAKRVAGRSHACLPKVESPFRWLAVVGDPYGDSLSIHQRKPSS